jgi:hypothetical protein
MIRGESMTDKVAVRTTMEPDKDIEMTVTEAEDLRRQGLLAPQRPERTAKPKGDDK